MIADREEKSYSFKIYSSIEISNIEKFLIICTTERTKKMNLDAVRVSMNTGSITAISEKKIKN